MRTTLLQAIAEDRDLKESAVPGSYEGNMRALGELGK